MLLGHLAETAAEQQAWRSVARALKDGHWRTPDLGGSAGTADVTRAVVDASG